MFDMHSQKILTIKNNNFKINQSLSKNKGNQQIHRHLKKKTFDCKSFFINIIHLS